MEIKHLQIVSSGTVFFNNGASIENVQSHKVDFKFSAKPAGDIMKIDSLLKKNNSGTFTVSALIMWK